MKFQERKSFFVKFRTFIITIYLNLSIFFVGHSENFEGEKIFENTNTEPGKIAVAIYAGIFSYSGWNYLNFMTEELKDPYV